MGVLNTRGLGPSASLLATVGLGPFVIDFYEDIVGGGFVLYITLGKEFGLHC